MIRGVIFDMDGVMTDTERLFLTHWTRVLTERGYPPHPEVAAYCAGLSQEAIDAYVYAVLGSDFDYPGILKEIGIRMGRQIETGGVPVKPGLYELLDGLDRRGIPWAVATSSSMEHAARRLRQIGVLHRLRGLIAGDMVSAGKPEPEIFLRASETLGLPPQDCLVLEDSPHGILAAHRAGCLPVMIPDLQEPDAETRKRLYARLDSLGGVLPLLDAEKPES